MVLLKGWKYVAFLGSIVGFIGIATYPIIISPMLDSSDYSNFVIFHYVILVLQISFFFNRKNPGKNSSWHKTGRYPARK